MTHQELTQIADEAFAAAKQRGGSWIACHDGCDSCCRRPFAITQDDAALLLAGLSHLGEVERAAIEARADACRARFSFDFPGDVDTGTLTDREDWRNWFFEKHDGVPCPVLNPETGACLLYEFRPVACRLYGPLIQIGDQTTDPCPLCYKGATPEEVKAVMVWVPLPPTPQADSDTLIAFALSSPK